MFSSSFYFKTIILLALFIVVISCMFIPFFYSENLSNTSSSPISYDSIDISSSGFAWPTPGCTRITSTFGYRISPTGQPGNFHSGLDIGAQTGTNLVAVCDGKITFTGWSGSGGYAIILSYNNLKISYCHTSSHFFVSTGDYVYRGQVIGMVGPKNVYEISNNPYKDSNGNPTNGDMTGPHLHLTLKKDGKAVDPMILFE